MNIGGLLVLALVCGSLGCGGAGGLKGGAGGTGGANVLASGGASGGGTTGNAATGGTGAGGAATGGVGAGGTGTGGTGTGGAGTGGTVGAGGAASGGIGTGGIATGGSAGTTATGGTGLGGTGTGGAATGGAGAAGAGAAGAGAGGAATGGAGAGGSGTGGQASGGTGGQSATTKVICPDEPVCDTPMINGSSNGTGPDGCILGFCCVSVTLGIGSARMLLVNGQLTTAIPTNLEYEGMQPLAYGIYASSRKPDQAQATDCETLSMIKGPSKLFCPASPDSQPACGETVQLQVDYQWGTIGCYAHTDYSSFLTATVSAEVECLSCPATQPANGATEASLPVGTECLYNNGATGCRVVRPSSDAPQVIWQCAPRAGADAGSNPNRG
jgi:hypothetical protein